MRPPVPPSVPTLGTLNIIFGALLSFCCSASLIAWAVGSGSFFMDDDLEEARERFLQNELPLYRVATVSVFVASILTFLLMLISGIGLASRKNWGRIMAIAMACLLIPLALGATIYGLAFVAPAEVRFFRTIAAPMMRDQTGFVWIGHTIETAIWLLFFIYAFLTLALLLSRGVRDYFSQATFDLGRYYEDDDWGDDRRHRRRDGWR